SRRHFAKTHSQSRNFPVVGDKAIPAIQRIYCYCLQDLFSKNFLMLRAQLLHVIPSTFHVTSSILQIYFNAARAIYQI
ncbi:MAG: hypothetical protein ABIU55_02435, partial [Ferruginibacter sp.]